MSEDTTPESATRHKLRSFDSVSLVAALIFTAAGIVGLVGESLADIDLVVLAGVALVATGVARFASVPLRSRARRKAAEAGQTH